MSGKYVFKRAKPIDAVEFTLKKPRHRKAPSVNKLDDVENGPIGSDNDAPTSISGSNTKSLPLASSTNVLEEENEVSQKDHCSSQDDFLFCNTIAINPTDSYLIELRKVLGIILLQGNRVFILPDFNETTFKLMFTKIVIVSRRIVYQQHDEKAVWLYSCQCDKWKKDLIDSLPDFITDPVEDQCIHVKMVKLYLEDDCVDADDEDELTEAETTDLVKIPFCPSKQAVIVKGEIGIISWEYGKIKCSVCEYSCIHEKYAKEKGFFEKEEEKEEEVVVDEKDDEYLFSVRRPSVILDGKQKEILSKGVGGFPKALIDGTEHYYAMEDMGEKCLCGTTFDYSLTDKRFQMKYFISRDEFIPIAVFELICQGCLRVYNFDGYDNAVMHYGKFLLHHSVLRDYMFHFLNGNSCTLHSFYDVLKQHQNDSSNEQFDIFFRYDIWRRCWYGFLKLMEIDTENPAIKKCFVCPKCGPELDLVVCDATTLGFQRKYQIIAFPHQKRELEETFPRISTQDTRIAIADKQTRDLLLKWCNAKMKPSEVHALKRKLASFDPIYDVFIWTSRCFTVSTPKGIVQMFRSLATPSPVCSYFPQGEDIERISMYLFDKEVKSKFIMLSSIRDHLPLFYHVLMDLFEPCLPIEWKSLIQYLTIKSNEPFHSTNRLKDTTINATSAMDFFPWLPQCRGRGSYEMDKSKAPDLTCTKNYKGHHRTLMPGIFTIFCQHGINYGFQVMKSAESPDVPFTIFKTRFSKAPKVIVYDNACGLHKYCLNRDPYFFQDTRFFVDRFHWPNHKGCSIGYHIGYHSTMQDVNSQINEQQNSAIKKLKSQLSFMAPKNFMSHCTFFLWYKNTLKINNVK